MGCGASKTTSGDVGVDERPKETTAPAAKETPTPTVSQKPGSTDSGVGEIGETAKTVNEEKVMDGLPSAIEGK